MAPSRLQSLQRTLRRTRGDRSTSVLLIALGALAGVALGVVIADRAGGIDGLLRRGGPRGVRRPRTDGWRGDGRRTDSFDGMADDDSELSPESIAHMHVADAPTRGVAGTRTGRGGPLPDRRPVSERRALSVHRAPATGVSAAGAPDEAALEARVLTAFLHDPILRERAIDICASDAGTIELTGWVQAASEIGHALTLARGVPDVSSVVDRLAVRGADLPRDHSSHRYAGPPAGAEGTVRGD